MKIKNWIKNNYKTLIITSFLIPIIIVAIVSISHVTQWYGMSNPLSWALYLSIGIEIAALSSLAAIAANMGNKVYVPFIIVTIIQFIGNVFYTYNYINVDSKLFTDWIELVSPILVFIGVEEGDVIAHKRFISLFAGGMLPLISLSFLHMLVKFTEQNENKTEIMDMKDIASEISKIRLSDDDLTKLNEILEKKEPINIDNDDELKKKQLMAEKLKKDNILESEKYHHHNGHKKKIE